MPKEMIKKPIDGHEYLIGQLTTTKQLKLLARLNRVLLGPLGNLAGDTDKEIELSKMKFDVKAACEALAANLTEDVVVQIVVELMEPVMRDGKPIDFDTDFQGEMKHLFKVVGASMEAQFGDFFGEVSEKLKSVAAVIARAASQQSTGTSGGQSSPGKPAS